MLQFFDCKPEHDVVAGEPEDVRDEALIKSEESLLTERRRNNVHRALIPPGKIHMSGR